MTQSCKIAVFGLGAMGGGMARACLAAGHVTHGFDVMAERMRAFEDEGGAPGALEDVAAELDAALIVVLNAAQTEEVLFGETGLVPRLRAGAVVLACATVAPDFARQMEARCASHGVLYLDSPISGGAGKAAGGVLSVMAAGRPEAFEAAGPALDAVSETVFRLGDSAGPGSAMKAVNQLLAGVHLATMGEALAFGMTQGVAPETFFEVITQCAGNSWILENRVPHVVAGDYTPLSQINIWPKDLGIVLDIAKSAGFSAPITATALQQFMVAVGQGMGAEDDAAIAKVYARNVGLSLPGEASDGSTGTSEGEDG